MPKIGLKNIHIAKLLTDTATGTTYEAPKKLMQAVQADIKPSSSSENFYADDQIAETTSTLNDIAVDLEVGQITTEMQAFLLGATVNEDGVIEYSANDTAPYVALGYESALSGGGSRMEWLYKGKFGIPESSSKTKGDKVEYQTEKISGTFIARQSDGKWKANVDTSDSGVDESVIAAWFTTVYKKVPTV